MTGPAHAIAWELWRAARLRLAVIAAVLFGFGVLNHFVFAGSSNESFALRLGYVVTVAAVSVTIGTFHFTEGRRKAGFGSFPFRLYTLPVSTHCLVAWPMVYGALAVAGVYLICATLLIRPFTESVAYGRPTLYLVSGLLCFQAVLWSIPEQRYLKLFTLSAAAAALAIGWMFFKPELLNGTLLTWGYQGDPQTFERGLTFALVALCGGAFGMSWFRVQQQRTGAGGSLRLWERFRDAVANGVLRRRRPIVGAQRALYWYEWRQSGLILPACIAIILVLTYVPTYLTRPHSESDTLATLVWLLIVPFLFASLLGRGFGKVDFWRTDLGIPTFLAVRPVTAGEFVLTKMKVAATSAGLTWLLLLLSGFVWFAYAGNLLGVYGIWSYWSGFYRTPSRQVLVLGLTVFAMGLVTWRLLLGSFVLGLSGRGRWYGVSNGIYTVGLIGFLAFAIHQFGNSDERIPLYAWWPWIESLPVLLGVLAVIRFGVAGAIWMRLVARSEITPVVGAQIFGSWLAGTTLLIAWAMLVASGVAWIRYLLCLAALFVCPLTSPALAIRMFSLNRSR